MDARRYSDALTRAGILGRLSWRVAISDRRRSIGLTVEPGGALAVTVPPGAEPADVVTAVRARLPWTVRTSSRQIAIAADHPAKEIVSGEDFPYLGRSRRLLLVDTDDDDVHLAGDRLIAAAGDPDRVAESIIAWYGRAGMAWLDDQAPQWARRLGVRPVALSVANLGRRWGQRTGAGGITLHWAVFQLAQHLVDLVVVHELAHLTEPGHGTAFRRLVGRVLPDHAERSEELARSGSGVWLGDLAHQQTGDA